MGRIRGAGRARGVGGVLGARVAGNDRRASGGGESGADLF